MRVSSALLIFELQIAPFELSGRNIELIPAMKTLRWLLVIPAAIAAWYATFVLGIFTWERVERLLCPQQSMISGACADPSIQRTLRAVELFFTALSAVAVVGAASAMAPSHRRVIAWTAFCAGAIVAVYLSIGTGLYTGGAAAIGAGLITAMLIARRRAQLVQPVPG